MKNTLKLISRRIQQSFSIKITRGNKFDFLGLTISILPGKTVKIHQHNLITKKIEKLKVTKFANTPYNIDFRVLKTSHIDSKLVKETQRLVGGLNYYARSRPDIQFITNYYGLLH